MYDFTTPPRREGSGSVKWAKMRESNPEVPADIVPLSVADMEFKTAPEITRGLTEFIADLVFGYDIPMESYYDAIIRWMKRRHGWDIEKDWILLSEGVVPAFFNAVAAFTGPGDGVIIMPPVYRPFFMAVERNGRRIEMNNLVIEDGRYRIDFDDLEKKARNPAVRALLFCSPHNPVGRVWTEEELERVGRICLENGVLIIDDEIHHDLVMPGYRHRVFASLSEDLAQNTAVLTAPSKTFNIAGLHGSNVIIPNKKLRQRFLEVQCRGAAWPGLNILAYKASEIAYSRCGPWLDELVTVLDANRRLVEDFMKDRIPAVKVFPLEGTYLQWWDCRGLGMEYRELERFMTDEALLYLDEGYIFGECGRGFERINLACPPRVLEAALERLAAALGRRGL
jgi:putative C-S lyase